MRLLEHRSAQRHHPGDGVLRRLVDEPAGVPDADRAHVAGCPACLAGLAEARADAAATATALSAEGSTDVDLAWRRFSAAAPAPVHAVAPAPARRRRRLMRSPLVAAVGVVVVLGGAGAAAAGDWLQIFRTEQVAPVQVQTADLVSLPDLSDYGDLQVVSEPDVHPVADAAAAEQETGLDVPAVAALPAGVTGDPQYLVGGQVVAEFPFPPARAARAAAAAGEPLPPMPAGLDGSRFRLVAGPGVAATWGESHGIPALVVGRAQAPTAF